jgi:two-component system response regulator protein GraR
MKKMKKIQIIEDDLSIANELKELLENAEYEAVIVTDFSNVLAEIKKENADLILLDINIPKINGELLLQQLRKESNTPVIMVTSKNSEVDEVLSISYGADDYITKPYNPTILLLRIGAVLKRSERKLEKLTYHNLEIIPQKGIIKQQEKEIILTKNEMIIFLYLLQNQGKIVTRDELMTDLWNNDEYINDNALTVNISRLRAKLKEIGYEDVVETRKGQGYILHE